MIPVSEITPAEYRDPTDHFLLGVELSRRRMQLAEHATSRLDPLVVSHFEFPQLTHVGRSMAIQTGRETDLYTRLHCPWDVNWGMLI